MREKKVLIARTIQSIATFVVLLYLFIIIDNKIVFLPFLIGGLAVSLQYICLLCHKEKLANMFHQLFLLAFFIFAFGFFIFWQYISIARQEYVLTVIALPFLIIIIVLARRFLFKNIVKYKHHDNE